MRYRRQLNGFLCISLLLASHAVLAHRVIVTDSLAQDVKDEDVDSMERLWPARKKEDEGANVSKSVQVGKAIMQQLTCKQLPTVLAHAYINATRALANVCTATDCDLSAISKEETDLLAYGAAVITAIVGIAEKKDCLPETLYHEKVAPVMDSLTVTWGYVVQGAGVAQERLQRSMKLLKEYQTKVTELKSDIIDRRLIFPEDIEDPSNCPRPCIECTRQHKASKIRALVGGSKREERFAFKCTLVDGDGPPDTPELNCSGTEKQRSSKGMKSWCTVRDWKAAAVQSVKVLSTIVCETQAILSPLHSGRDMSSAIKETCLDVEQGKAVSKESMTAYKGFLKQSDEVVLGGVKAAFSIFVASGLAEGLADLRTLARGNTRSEVKARARNSSSILQENQTQETMDEEGGLLHGQKPISINFEDDDIEERQDEWEADMDEACIPKTNFFDTMGRAMLAFIAGTLIGSVIIFPAAVGMSLLLLALVSFIVGEKLTRMIAINGLISLGVVAVGAVVGVASIIFITRKIWQRIRKRGDCYGRIPDGNGDTGEEVCEGKMRFGKTKEIDCMATGVTITVTCAKENGGALTLSHPRQACVPQPKNVTKKQPSGSHRFEPMVGLLSMCLLHAA